MVQLPSRLRAIVDKYKNTRSFEFLPIKGVQARLLLKPDATPVFVRARPVPFKLLPLIEQELDKLESVGIIEKVTTSKWATPIVPIFKKKMVK